MWNKNGKSGIENIIILVGGIGVALFFLFTIFKSGIYGNLVSSLTNVFGPLGAILAFLFIIMVVVAIFENLKRR